MTRGPRLGTFRGFQNTAGPTFKHPTSYKSGVPSATSGLSCLQNWDYGIIHALWVESRSTGDLILKIVSADGLRVLHNVQINSAAAAQNVFERLNWPVYEPWAIDTSVTDATLSVGGTFEVVSTTS